MTPPLVSQRTTRAWSTGMPSRETGECFGWTVHVLTDSRPDPTDPRRSSPLVEGWGAGFTLPEVMDMANSVVAERAQPRGLSYEESYRDLLWGAGPFTLDS